MVYNNECKIILKDQSKLKVKLHVQQLVNHKVYIFKLASFMPLFPSWGWPHLDMRDFEVPVDKKKLGKISIILQTHQVDLGY